MQRCARGPQLRLPLLHSLPHSLPQPVLAPVDESHDSLIEVSAATSKVSNDSVLHCLLVWREGVGISEVGSVKAVVLLAAGGVKGPDEVALCAVVASSSSSRRMQRMSASVEITLCTHIHAAIERACGTVLQHVTQHQRCCHECLFHVISTSLRHSLELRAEGSTW
jgi:hypothetical protein